MNYLLDTCVLSEVRKKLANQGMVDWLGQIEESRLYISVITLGEIQKGISKLAVTRQQGALQLWFGQDLKQRFTQRMLTVDEVIALEWGCCKAKQKKHGIPLPVIDTLIAATAITRNLMVVTRNHDDFSRFPVRLLDPWIDRN